VPAWPSPHIVSAGWPAVRREPGCSTRICRTGCVWRLVIVFRAPSSRRDLEQLVRALGWSPSRVVREALRRLAASHPLPKRPRLAGLAKFSSGVADLGSNKKHLKGFGR
jgi:hypothetical protein